jgi:hypothetical protein
MGFVDDCFCFAAALLDGVLERGDRDRFVLDFWADDGALLPMMHPT